MIEFIVRTVTVQRNIEFEKKGLASHGLDTGLSCDHACTYCSSPSIYRTHKVFKRAFGKSAYAAHRDGDFVIDLDTPKRIAESVKGLTADHTVMFSPKTDPWCPTCRKHDLGKKCLKAFFDADHEAHLRILTKSIAVVEDLKGFTQYKNRIHVSLSITAPRSKSALALIMEPNASTIEERLDALKALRTMGFKAYGMICPCTPGLLDTKADFEELLPEIIDLYPERIWIEALNGRGTSIKATEQAFRNAGHQTIADEIKKIRKDKGHDDYVKSLVKTANEVGQALGCDGDFKFLVYNDLRAELKAFKNVIYLSAHKREVLFVKTSDIKRDSNKPRRFFDVDAQEDLENSISVEGILEPLLVRKVGDEIILTAGERRLRAAKNVGLKKVPVIMVNEEQPAEMSMKENLLRENLGPVELAEGFKRMVDECGYRQADLQEFFGKAKSTISEILSLNKLPSNIKDICRKEPEKYPLHELKLVAKKKSIEDAKRAFTALQAKVDNRGKSKINVGGQANKVSSAPLDWFTSGVSALTKSVQENIGVALSKDVIIGMRDELVALKVWIENLLKDVPEPEDSQPEKFVNANSEEQIASALDDDQDHVDATCYYDANDEGDSDDEHEADEHQHGATRCGYYDEDDDLDPAGADCEEHRLCAEDQARLDAIMEDHDPFDLR